MRKLLLSLLIICTFGCKENFGESKVKGKQKAKSPIENNQFKENKITELSIKQLTETLDSLYNIENLELKDFYYKPINEEFYSLIDSNQVKSFKHYSEFRFIEFKNVNIANHEFGKIKLIAKKSVIDKKELFDYHLIFSKGGTSFNLVNNWIIIHNLRCNMYPKDLATDKLITSEFEKLNYDVDWIRTYCGWVKIEIK